ncbi:TIGR03084 family metal-binding protein, partial [Saccharomonospora halophila]|uniref:TIGR03084 family metal-binding protein n=1 Tax=Saccharomonospora halophila TaxID=129922 RepID=UPI0003818C44
MTSSHRTAPDVITDFDTEVRALDRVLTALPDTGWRTPTPAPGWTIAHQVAHLTATFDLAALAASDADGFAALAGALSDDFDSNVEAALSRYVDLTPTELLAQWRRAASAASHSLRAADPQTPVPWLVRSLPPRVLTEAGMMELFAHGQDILDALGSTPERTDRLYHVALFSTRTWDFGYLARDLPVPEATFHFELTAPSGAVWSFGDEHGGQRITGPAVDFCLLTTRRRHRADLAVRAVGADAEACASAGILGPFDLLACSLPL